MKINSVTGKAEKTTCINISFSESKPGMQGHKECVKDTRTQYESNQISTHENISTGMHSARHNLLIIIGSRCGRGATSYRDSCEIGSDVHFLH